MTKIQRNEPCPCGSGRKFLHWRYLTPSNTIATYLWDTTQDASLPNFVSLAEPLLADWIAADIGGIAG